MLVKWLGPRNLTMTVDHHEARDGGKWRFIHRDAEGNDYGFHGVYHGTPAQRTTNNVQRTTNNDFRAPSP
jgi:uncharacterized protein YndB with AHSA1/START domain